jgi:hypothetical protein
MAAQTELKTTVAFNATFNMRKLADLSLKTLKSESGLATNPVSS